VASVSSAQVIQQKDEYGKEMARMGKVYERLRPKDRAK